MNIHKLIADEYSKKIVTLSQFQVNEKTIIDSQVFKKVEAEMIKSLEVSQKLNLEKAHILKKNEDLKRDLSHLKASEERLNDEKKSLIKECEALKVKV